MADITKIQHMNDSTQYELGARYLTTARTLTIGNTGKTFNGTANVSWSKDEILGASNNANFLRGDKTWTATINNTITCIPATTNMAASNMAFNGGIQLRESGGVTNTQSAIEYGPRISFHWGQRTAKSITLHSNGIFYFRDQDGTTRSTIDANLQGNASSASSVAWGNVTGKPSTFSPSSHSHSEYVLKNSSYNGNLNSCTTSGFYRINASQSNAPGSWGQLVVCHGNSDTIFQLYGEYSNGHFAGRAGNPSDVGGSGSWSAWRWFWMQGDSITGAVWNDYAEYREVNEAIPGQCVYEVGDDTLLPTTERMQHFAGIVSDTWGFCQGKTDNATIPIAVAGRVLAYTYRSRDEYKPGDVLCAAPGGTVDIMTREEIMQYPDRIVGTVSCVPNYEEWGGGELADRQPVQVDGRIWVKVK